MRVFRKEFETEKHERIEGIAGNMEKLRDYQVTKSRHEEFYQIGFFHKSSTGRVTSHGRYQMRSKHGRSLFTIILISHCLHASLAAVYHAHAVEERRWSEPRVPVGRGTSVKDRF
jgi:hypothetical protein